jgi:hypothetical protein
MCHNMGAKVIMFKNYGKYIDFKNNYALKVIGYNENFWIGAEAKIPLVFYWYDDNSSLAKWLWPGHEPNNKNSNEFCVFNAGNTFLMADVRCDVPFKTICEYSN